MIGLLVARALGTNPQYIGDDMSGPGCGAGTTAYEALYSLAKERGIVRTSVDGKGSGVSQVT
jgi:hypothetical protein